ncbi:MAG TPA: hypothetical protein VNK52_08110 [Hyphomicrobiaceae bacterium]|nr:hypothetical protein [Hyphomicrobiaceae bacterium]
MNHLRTAGKWARTAPGEPHMSRGLPAIAASLVVAPVVVLAWLLPPALVLPASSLVLLMGAAIAALAAWLGRIELGASRITLWDLAGAFAFIGFAAGALSEPMHAAQLLGVAPPNP